MPQYLSTGRHFGATAMAVNSERAEAIFTAAQARPPAERAPFVEGACRDDPELRDRVEALIRAYEGLGSFLEPPTRPDGPGADVQRPDVQRPDGPRPDGPRPDGP